jgi:hypothetical protein
MHTYGTYHTILNLADHALFYVLLRSLRPELDGQMSCQIMESCLPTIITRTLVIVGRSSTTSLPQLTARVIVNWRAISKQNPLKNTVSSNQLILCQLTRWRGYLEAFSVWLDYTTTKGPSAIKIWVLLFIMWAFFREFRIIFITWRACPRQSKQ